MDDLLQAQHKASSTSSAQSTKQYLDATGNTYKETDGLGHTVFQNTINSRGWVTASEDGLGNTTTYTLDKEGRTLTTTDPTNKTTSFTLDALGRTVKTEDANNNVTQSLYNADGQAVVSLDGSSQPAFDIPNPVGQQTYQIDALSGITQKKYDVFGNMIQRSYDDDGAGPDSAVVTKYAFESLSGDVSGAGSVGNAQWNAWADLDNSGSLTTRRLYEKAIDAVFARMDASGNVAWYLKDHLGSVRDLVDGTGTLKDHLDFDGWGNITSETHSDFGDRYKYTSREWDAEIRSQQDPDKAALDRDSGISCVHSYVHCCFKNHARLPLADIEGHALGHE